MAAASIHVFSPLNAASDSPNRDRFRGAFRPVELVSCYREFRPILCWLFLSSMKTDGANLFPGISGFQPSLRLSTAMRHLRLSALKRHIRLSALTRHLRSSALTRHLRLSALTRHLRLSALPRHLRSSALTWHLRLSALTRHLGQLAFSL